MARDYIKQIQDIFEAQHYPVTLRDTNHNIIYSNPAASELLGIDRKSLPIKCYRTFHDMDSLPESCVCGYGETSCRSMEIIEPSLKSVLNRACLPVESPAGGIIGYIDLFTRVSGLHRSPGAFSDNQPVVISQSVEKDWQITKGFDALTDKEVETLMWVKRGKSTADISKLMNISLNTVNFHIKNIFSKIGANSRAHAVALAYRDDIAKKDTFIRELNHRVRNNFSVLSSIISMHSASITDKSALKALNSVNTLIEGFVSFHSLLIDDKASGRVSLGEFVEKVIDNNRKILRGQKADIHLTSELEEVLLDMNTAIPCMQIVNELVSNAVEHAFKDIRQGNINIRAEKVGGRNLWLSVRDNGTGLPHGFEPGKCKTTGMVIVRALVEQLEGSLKAASSQGTEFTVCFPLPEPR